MKIYSQYNTANINEKRKPKNASSNIAFKGWFAAPIKEIYFQPNCTHKMKPFFKEMIEKCSKYFDLKVQLKDAVVDARDLKYKYGYVREAPAVKNRWGQDNKIFLDDSTIGICTHNDGYKHSFNLNKILKLNETIIKKSIVGGNCFMGKKQNGETFALLGSRALNRVSADDIARELKVETKNLYSVFQPNFHLDMAIRPLNYPTILVGDDKLLMDILINEKKIGKRKLKSLRKFFHEGINEKSLMHPKPDKTVEELRAQGFNAIKVPGLLGKGNLNYMNAFVHQLDDGSLVYITNKSKLSKKLHINFEKIFSDYIKAEEPAIKEVIFIDGKGFIPNGLVEESGGLHCAGAEKPDFAKLEKLVQNAT